MDRRLFLGSLGAVGAAIPTLTQAEEVSRSGPIARIEGWYNSILTWEILQGLVPEVRWWEDKLFWSLPMIEPIGHFMGEPLGRPKNVYETAQEARSLENLNPKEVYREGVIEILAPPIAFKARNGADAWWIPLRRNQIVTLIAGYCSHWTWEDLS